MPFFIIFIGIPLLELGVFIAVSDHIGLLTTLFLCLLTAVTGGFLVREQGLSALTSIRGSMGRGEMPLNELFDGLCLVAAGAMLITPGFVTDIVGFSLLTPPFRVLLRHVIKNHTNWSASFKSTGPGAHQRPRDPGVIEGEYVHVETEEQDSKDDDKLS